jgi:hypothetical protein
MTSLTKTVRRKTRFPYAVLYAGNSRPTIVSLEPGDVITFREAGRRQVWSGPIDQVFRQAVRETARGLRHEKRGLKKMASVLSRFPARGIHHGLSPRHRAGTLYLNYVQVPQRTQSDSRRSRRARREDGDTKKGRPPRLQLLPRAAKL